MMAYKSTLEQLESESEAMRVRIDPKIGISKLIVEAPQTYFSYVELANALNAKDTKGRKVEPGKIKDGLGIEKARLPTYSQSNVTMAANAIYMSPATIARLLSCVPTRAFPYVRPLSATLEIFKTSRRKPSQLLFRLPAWSRRSPSSSTRQMECEFMVSYFFQMASATAFVIPQSSLSMAVPNAR